MNFFSDERAAELRQLFFDSAQELLQQLNEQGLEMERQPSDAEVVRGIRRTVHTLKGDSAACGFRELSELAHDLEDVLTPDQAAASGPELANLVLSAADMFEAMVAAYKGSLEPPKGDSLRALIAKLVSKPAAPVKPAEVAIKTSFDWSEYARLTMEDAASQGDYVFNIAIRIDPACPMRAAGVQLLLNTLHDCGTVLAHRPEDLAATEAGDVLEVAFSTQLSVEALERKCRIPSVVDSVLIRPYNRTEAAETAATENAPSEHDVLGIAQAEPTSDADVAAAAPTPATEPMTALPADSTQEETEDILALAGFVTPEQKPKSRAQEAAPMTGETLRVDAERIDAVMNLVGELIIGKSVLLQTLNEFGRRFPKDVMRGRLADAIAQQAQVLNALQRSVMKIRMVPVDQLFRRFPRLVRDTARQVGKDVQMVVSGADTDLDKSILDALAEPLTHLVRNAVDHGIETPEERKRAGKSPQGTLKLNAYHQANHVVLEISDDGRGIDPDRIAHKAMSIGLRAIQDISSMSDQEKLELIFEPGLSTAEQVTEVSGRGIGMDVVRTVINRMKGSVTIQTAPGQGTTFRLMLPLTLAIIKALLFRAGQQIYAVPLGSVVEITRAHEADVHLVENSEVLQLRETLITLVRLSRMLPSEDEDAQKFFVVVVQLAGRKFGLVVDRLVGEEELVIKAMHDSLVATELVSGASILGDGTVVLILNIPAVVERLGKTRFSALPVPPSESQQFGAIQ